MIITRQGTYCFKFQVGDLVVATNPVSKKSKEKAVRFGADIALVSLNHPDFNGIENLTHGDRAPFVVKGPGEYEVRGVPIRGFSTKTTHGDGKEKTHTIYTFTLDGIDVLFLGPISEKKLSEQTYEQINNVDVLFVPACGKDLLSPSEAHKIALPFSPSIIVPLYCDSASLKKFLNEAGAETVKPEEKLTIKKKDVAEREGDVVVLKSD
jgi:hypothetical protein